MVSRISRSSILSMGCFVLLLLPVSMPIVVNAAQENLIAKSGFIHVSEPGSNAFDERRIAYIPAGTRIIKFDEAITYRGSKRYRLLTETGLWGYIKEGLFWNKARVTSFSTRGATVFVKRRLDITSRISEDLQIKIRFTRGEAYRLLDEKETHFVIELSGADKLRNIATNVSLQVNIPRENASLVRFDSVLRQEDINYFQLSIVDGIKGIRKPCNTTQAKASRVAAGAGVGFDLSKFFTFLSAKGGVEASTETEKLEEFDEDTNVTRTYYTRPGQSGVYRITKYQKCIGATQHIHYIYTNPDNEEIIVDKDWAERANLKTDRRTGQVLVTCPPQYFAFKDELIGRGFREDEIPFIISSVAKFKKVGTSCQVE